MDGQAHLCIILHIRSLDSFLDNGIQLSIFSEENIEVIGSSSIPEGVVFGALVSELSEDKAFGFYAEGKTPEMVLLDLTEQYLSGNGKLLQTPITAQDLLKQNICNLRSISWRGALKKDFKCIETKDLWKWEGVGDLSMGGWVFALPFFFVFFKKTFRLFF